MRIVQLRHVFSLRSMSSKYKAGVSPAALARDVRKIASHPAAGIESRSRHFCAAAKETPTSAANSPSDGHNSVTSRNDETIHSDLGQFVYGVKPIVSNDTELFFGSIGGMDRMSETEEKLAFIKRTKAARMARFETQRPICLLLGVDQTTYSKYETRTPLPHRHIPKFCAATGISYEWLLTGEGSGPALPQSAPKPERRTRRLRRDKAA